MEPRGAIVDARGRLLTTMCDRDVARPLFFNLSLSGEYFGMKCVGNNVFCDQNETDCVVVVIVVWLCMRVSFNFNPSSTYSYADSTIILWKACFQFTDR